MRLQVARGLGLSAEEAPKPKPVRDPGKPRPTRAPRKPQDKGAKGEGDSGRGGSGSGWGGGKKTSGAGGEGKGGEKGSGKEKEKEKKEEKKEEPRWDQQLFYEEDDVFTSECGAGEVESARGGSGWWGSGCVRRVCDSTAGDSQLLSGSSATPQSVCALRLCMPRACLTPVMRSVPVVGAPSLTSMSSFVAPWMQLARWPPSL